MMSCVLSFGVSAIVSGAFLFATQSGANPDAPVKKLQASAEALPLSVKFVAPSFLKDVRRESLQWEGRAYDIESGIVLLVRIVKDPATSPDERALALDRLGIAGLHLKGKGYLDEIVELYATVETVGEKAGILSCLRASDDPRGLPLLYKALGKERDPILRLLAANALARWNIRRGVQELIELMPSNVKLGDRHLGGEAAGAFHFLNKAKGWGCPDEEILQTAASGFSGDRDRYLRALANGFQEWFAENEHRFPDWKLGDPLPETPSDKDKNTSEDKDAPKDKP